MPPAPSTTPTAAREVVSRTAVLLIAHGSRRASANDDLTQLAEILRRRGDYPIVEHAYLELASPTIPEGARACVGHGATRVLMLPYFLSAGQHVARDLEHFRAEFSTLHPRVEFRLCPPLGLHSLMVDIVLERLSSGDAGDDRDSSPSDAVTSR